MYVCVVLATLFSREIKSFVSNNLDYDEASSPVSISFSLPVATELAIIGGAIVGGDERCGCGVVGPGLFANCQAGIEGLPKSGIGEEGELETAGPRLSRRVLRDFNSCCNSARD